MPDDTQDPYAELGSQANSADTRALWCGEADEPVKIEQRIGIIGAVLRAQPRMVPFVERLLLISEKMGS